MAGIEDIYLNLFDSLRETAGVSGSTFPYTDIYTDSKKNARIDIALPGYQKELIKVRLDGSTLIITAKAPEFEKGIIFLEQGIIRKNVKRVIKLSSYYQGGKITPIFKDGILSITVEESEHKPSDIKILGSDEFDEIITKEDVDKTKTTNSKIDELYEELKKEKTFTDYLKTVKPEDIVGFLNSNDKTKEYLEGVDKDKFLNEITKTLDEMKKEIDANTESHEKPADQH
jgi:hypothetical protein